MNKLNDLEKDFSSGKYDKILNDVYLDETFIDRQRNRYIDAIKKYREIFGEEFEIDIISSPGRSEICGNHTDHQHGMVLAGSVNLDLIALASKNDENRIRLFSEGYDMIDVDLSDLSVNTSEYGSTKSLIKGVAKGLKDNGFKIGGFCAYVTGDVPIGSGLSSSAAFEVLVGTIFSELFNNSNISPIVIATIAQFAENIYFNKPCGLMDQMTCSVGGLVNIDFKHPESPIVNKINVEFEKYDYSLCIVDTKGSHVDLTGEYAAIPNDMKKIAMFFKQKFLRDCSEDEFFANISKLRETIDDRAILRAAHFFKEEENVKNAVSYLNNDDFSNFLGVIKASGNSSFKYLQNIYVNSNIENQSISLALATSEHILKDNGVCRVHGGGFAGTIQSFVKNDFTKQYKTEIEKIFGENACRILKVRKYGSMKIV